MRVVLEHPGGIDSYAFFDHEKQHPANIRHICVSVSKGSVDNGIEVMNLPPGSYWAVWTKGPEVIVRRFEISHDKEGKTLFVHERIFNISDRNNEILRPVLRGGYFYPGHVASYIRSLSVK